MINIYTPHTLWCFDVAHNYHVCVCILLIYFLSTLHVYTIWNKLPHWTWLRTEPIFVGAFFERVPTKNISDIYKDKEYGGKGTNQNSSRFIREKNSRVIMAELLGIESAKKEIVWWRYRYDHTHFRILSSFAFKALFSTFLFSCGAKKQAKGKSNKPSD